jgi:hypothetical protein
MKKEGDTMKEVNADLYEFLNNHEISMSYNGKLIEAFVFIDFRDIEDFTRIVGSSYFDEEGVECILKSDYICIDIVEFIEGDGHNLSSYQNCFKEEDWERYGKQILESEE